MVGDDLATARRRVDDQIMKNISFSADGPRDYAAFKRLWALYANKFTLNEMRPDDIDIVNIFESYGLRKGELYSYFAFNHMTLYAGTPMSAMQTLIDEGFINISQKIGTMHHDWMHAITKKRVLPGYKNLMVSLLEYGFHVDDNLLTTLMFDWEDNQNPSDGLAPAKSESVEFMKHLFTSGFDPYLHIKANNLSIRFNNQKRNWLAVIAAERNLPNENATSRPRL